VALKVPNRYLLVAGAGDAATSLNAFDRALIASGAGNFNLVKVTSIMPPGAVPGRIDSIPPGMIVHAALGSHTSRHKGGHIAAAVAIGLPVDPTQPGVIMEGHFEMEADEAERLVRSMAEQALRDRRSEILRVESVSAGHQVVDHGAALAAVLLWHEE